jgi:hypothetical protein
MADKDMRKRGEAAFALVCTGMLQGTLLELEYGLETARVTMAPMMYVCHVQNNLILCKGCLYKLIQTAAVRCKTRIETITEYSVKL